jgi:hypothetical protein
MKIETHLIDRMHEERSCEACGESIGEGELVTWVHEIDVPVCGELCAERLWQRAKAQTV